MRLGWLARAAFVFWLSALSCQLSVKPLKLLAGPSAYFSWII
jgi:hypothetical protein